MILLLILIIYFSFCGKTEEEEDAYESLDIASSRDQPTVPKRYNLNDVKSSKGSIIKLEPTWGDSESEQEGYKDGEMKKIGWRRRTK